MIFPVTKVDETLDKKEHRDTFLGDSDRLNYESCEYDTYVFALSFDSFSR